MLVTVDYSDVLGSKIKNDIVKLLYLTARCMIYHERREMKTSIWIEGTCAYTIKVDATDVSLFDDEGHTKLKIHSYDDTCEMDSSWYSYIVNNEDPFAIECMRVIINDIFVKVNGGVICEDYHKFNIDCNTKYGN